MELQFYSSFSLFLLKKNIEASINFNITLKNKICPSPPIFKTKQVANTIIFLKER